MRLATGGLALGMMQDAQYASGSVELEPGDVLVAFTDGITEAMSVAGEEWGEDRLIENLLADGPGTAASIAERVLSAARHFSRGAAQHDDMTVAVVRVL